MAEDKEEATQKIPRRKPFMSHGKREPGVPPKVKKVKKKVPTVTLPVEEEEASGVFDGQ